LNNALQTKKINQVALVLAGFGRRYAVGQKLITGQEPLDEGSPAGMGDPAAVGTSPS